MNATRHVDRRQRVPDALGSFKSYKLYWRSQITPNHRTMVGRKNTGMQRRYPIGAEIIGENETHFRVWAPKVKRLAVVSKNKTYPLAREAGGYFAGTANCGAGTHYKLQIDDGAAFPDPSSRFQPEGPHGPSCVVDPFSFKWTDANWRGVKLANQIIYEMHMGTFTPAGTWRAAIDKLSEFKESGISLLEMMPIPIFLAALAGVTTVSTFSRRRDSMEHPMICGRLSIAHMRLDSASFSTSFTITSGRTETISARFRIIICGGTKRTNGETRLISMGRTAGQYGSFSLPTRATGLRNSISMGFVLMRRKPFSITLRNIL